MIRRAPFPAAVLLIATWLAAASALHAQSEEGRISVGANVGLGSYLGTFDASPGPAGELFVRWNILPFLSLHGTLGVVRGSWDISDADILRDSVYFGPLAGGIGTGFYPGADSMIARERSNGTTIFRYGLLLSYNFIPDGKIVPYLFAGAGLATFDPRNTGQGARLPNNVRGLYSGSAFTVPFGAGLEWYATDELALTAKLEIDFTSSPYVDDYPGPGTERIGELAIRPADGPADHFASLSIGASYYIFGALDCDKDGLTDEEERRIGTDPCSPDTDREGLSDFEEVRRLGTDPLKADTDGDGLNDAAELVEHNTDPRVADTDADGLVDGREVERRTDPLKADTDGDALVDGDEVDRVKSDPLKADTDGDGLSDGEEATAFMTDPLKADTDGDNLADGEEVKQRGTDPKVPDTDGDSLGDGDEVLLHKTDPRAADTDKDKLGDGDEVGRTRTDPLKPDTDGDSVIDGDDLCPLVAGEPDRRGCPAPPKLGAVLDFPEIYFIVDTDEFDFGRPETNDNLAKVLRFTNQCPGLGIVIEGHASREGAEERNQQLSEMRARRVAAWLVERGVDANKVEATIGYGSARNAVAEPDPKSVEAKKMDPAKLESIRRQNRRIGIKVVRTCD